MANHRKIIAITTYSIKIFDSVAEVCSTYGLTYAKLKEAHRDRSDARGWDDNLPMTCWRMEIMAVREHKSSIAVADGRWQWVGSSGDLGRYRMVVAPGRLYLRSFKICKSIWWQMVLIGVGRDE